MFFLLDLSLLQFFSIFSILAFFKWGESYSHNMSELNETLEIFSFRDPQSIIRGSTRPLQGVHKVKIIFIIIPRCYLHLHSHQCKVSFPEATQYVLSQQMERRHRQENLAVSHLLNIKKICSIVGELLLQLFSVLENLVIFQ